VATMKDYKIIVVMLIIILVNYLPSTANDYMQKIDSFFQLVKEGKYEMAVDSIYSDNPWISSKRDDIQSLKNQFVGLKDFLGEFYSYEILAEESISDKYVNIAYFCCFDRQPLRFTFEYYKPNDSWRIYSFSYSEDIDIWLEEKVKQNYLDKK
jgi:hypothetical protein